MRPVLPLDQLVTFLAIVETGSLARAADRIGRSQSAVSMQLQKLERTVGTHLLDRDAHGIRLSEPGKVLLQQARRFRSLNDETWIALDEPLLEGRVRLGMPDDYAVGLLSPVLATFASKYPNVAVELVCEQSDKLFEALGSHRIDIAVFTRSASSPGVVLRREPLVWVAPPQGRIEHADPLPLALYQEGSLDRAYALRALKSARRRFRIAYSSPSIAGLVAALRAGLAVAVMTRCSVPEDFRVLRPSDGLPNLPPLEVAVSGSKEPLEETAQRLYDDIAFALSNI